MRNIKNFRNFNKVNELYGFEGEIPEDKPSASWPKGSKIMDPLNLKTGDRGTLRDLVGGLSIGYMNVKHLGGGYGGYETNYGFSSGCVTNPSVLSQQYVKTLMDEEFHIQIVEDGRGYGHIYSIVKLTGPRTMYLLYERNRPAILSPFNGVNQKGVPYISYSGNTHRFHVPGDPSITWNIQSRSLDYHL